MTDSQRLKEIESVLKQILEVLASIRTTLENQPATAVSSPTPTTLTNRGTDEPDMTFAQSRFDNETVNEIIHAWSELPLPAAKLVCSGAASIALRSELARLADDHKEPVHPGMILEAIANYKKALELPNSTAYQHMLFAFLKRDHVKKYLSYAFDIDNYKPRTNQDKPQKLQTIFGKYCSEEGCNMPARHKSIGSYGDFYYCVRHLPKRMKERYHNQGYKNDDGSDLI